MSEQKPGRPHAKAAKLFARAAGLIAVLSCLIASIDGRAASAFVTTATPPAQQAEASWPIELLEHLTPEEARELASRLPESEVREMLLGQLEKSSPPAEAPTPAVTPGMLGDMQAEMYVLRARLNEMLSALPNLPSIGPFVLKRITKQYEPEHVWALASEPDCLLVHQVVRENPGAAVRGPKLSVTEGKTPNLPAEEVAVLIESMPTDTLVGLRLLPGGIRTARGKTGELTENRVDATESDFLMSYLSNKALS